MSTIPCAWDVSCEMCPDFEDWPDHVQNSALWLASTFLWAATGRQYGICQTTIRPSQSARGEGPVYQDFAVLPGVAGLGVPGGPYLFGGRWFNSGCASACCGNSACAIVLRGPVASITSVTIGEETVPPSAYRVDVTNGTYLLVRTDGECWPVCQNFRANPGEPGAFEVTYGIGRELPEALAIATATLACEYGKKMVSGSCALPARMTRMSRQGVEVEIAPADPAEGMTGIKSVDDVVAALNPSRRQRPPVILSPDLPENCDRRTVWVGGA
jgi:hypothetical protein